MGQYAQFPDVNLSEAETLLEPDDTTEGNWVGAPCVHSHGRTVYLAVRERTPEERGRAVTIYEYDGGMGGSEAEVDGTGDGKTSDGETDTVTSDGETGDEKPGDEKTNDEDEDIGGTSDGGTTLTESARITADELGVVSVERPALVTDAETGALQLYLPVDTSRGTWEIRKLADVADPADFDPATARTVLAPEAGGSDAATVKDPYVLTVGGRYYMFYSGHDGISEQAHVATSADGETWTRTATNPVLGRQFWHNYHTRISCVVPAPDAPVWLVFYEGSGLEDYGKTWNLRTGLAISYDLERVADTTAAGPWLSAPTAERATGIESFATCRYLDVLDREDGWEVFAEVARPDGAFELRRAEVTP